MIPPQAKASDLPLVVQVGFAGARNLWDRSEPPDYNCPENFEDRIFQLLKGIVAGVQSEFAPSPKHFLCGISQIAIGADTLFTRVCKELNIRQRIFLPQHFDEYLNAAGSENPDFSESQKQVARDLLTAPHVIQEHVASDAADRHARFSDTNWEIVRVSDVLLCLVTDGQGSSAGGTSEMIKMAQKRGKPVLVATLHWINGAPEITTEWFNRDQYQEPELPHQLMRIPLVFSPTELETIQEPPQFPTARNYAEHLKRQASMLAKANKGLFKTAALIIIATHILATVCAVIAVQFYGWLAHGLFKFLIPELLLLALGFAVHHRLHSKEANHQWASSRLIAELGRSMLAIGNQYIYPKHLFQLPFPADLGPLLRTLNVLHVSSTNRNPSPNEWRGNRDEYVLQRLAGENGQIEFYSREAARAAKLLRQAHLAFNICSLGAFLATLLKLTHSIGEPGSLMLGPLAILLPVLAVAALSLAAAFDLQARKHTFTDMLNFLRGQHLQLADATTEREFCQIMLETESRLLGETVNWHSRRSFTGVA